MDLLKILWKSLHSKYKPDNTNYNIAQINSILFKYPIKYSIQYIHFRFKEMVYISDFEEYFRKYSYKDSVLKLKLLGYIYVNNFKPFPNYLSFDYDIYITMYKLIRKKQNLIDRNICTNLLLYERQKNKIEKEKNEKNNKYLGNNKNIENNKDNNIINSISFSKSSLNSSRNKNQNFEHNYIYELTNSKNKMKLFSLNKKYKGTKYENKIKDNSTISIKNLIKQFKKRKTSNIIDTPINNTLNKNTRYLLNTKTEIRKNNNKNKLSLKKSKTLFFSKQFFNNKNKYLELIKNIKKEKNKEYRLSLEQFKEKLKDNNTTKIKEYIDNYWKTNKNFVTNLIENQKLINHNKICFSPISISENSKNSSFLSMKLPLSSKSVKNKNNYFNKFKLFKKGKKQENNSLIMKIQNDSDFMKNKNYSCVFRQKNKNVKDLKHKKNISDKYIHYRNYNNNIQNHKTVPYRIMEAYTFINNNKLF